MGETTEGTSSIVKFGETAFERGLELSMHDGPVETVEYISVNISCMLIGICHKTAEMHFLWMQLIN